MALRLLCQDREIRMTTWWRKISSQFLKQNASTAINLLHFPKPMKWLTAASTYTTTIVSSWKRERHRWRDTSPDKHLYSCFSQALLGAVRTIWRSSVSMASSIHFLITLFDKLLLRIISYDILLLDFHRSYNNNNTRTMWDRAVPALSHFLSGAEYDHKCKIQSQILW